VSTTIRFQTYVYEAFSIVFMTIMIVMMHYCCLFNSTNNIISNIVGTVITNLLLWFNVVILALLCIHSIDTYWGQLWYVEKTRQENSMPLSANLMRSQVLYQAAHGFGLYRHVAELLPQSRADNGATEGHCNQRMTASTSVWPENKGMLASGGNQDKSGKGRAEQGRAGQGAPRMQPSRDGCCNT